VALFLGWSFADHHDGETIGLDYERRIGEKWGLGALVDRAEGDLESTVWAAGLFAHPTDDWTILVAPGFEHAHGEKEFLTRVGVGYNVPFEKFTLTPGVYLDMISGGETVTVVGVGIGRGF